MTSYVGAADAAVSNLGALAYKDKVSAQDIDPTGGSSGQVLSISKDPIRAVWEGTVQIDTSAMTATWTVNGVTVLGDLSTQESYTQEKDIG